MKYIAKVIGRGAGISVMELDASSVTEAAAFVKAQQLIGVTMQESGVSRIVDVDMEAAVKMAEA